MSAKQHTPNFYLFDLLKKLVLSKNIPALIYLILNIGVVAGIFYWLNGTIEGIVFGVVLYAIAATIALSPVGECLLRFVQGCKKIEDDKVLSRLEPLFWEVVERARTKQTDCIIHEKITLYIKEDPEPNAFALGRKTVCVTTGLLEYSDEEIKGILGHELGHLATHDTDLVLLITVGNGIITAFLSIVRAILFIVNIMMTIILVFVGGSEGFLGRILTSIYTWLVLLCVNCVMWVWTQIGILLVMKSSRDAEYEADAFSCDLGYTEGLLTFFEKLVAFDDYSAVHGVGKKTLVERIKEKTEVFAALSDSHPKTQKRIARIREAMGNSADLV